MRGRVGAAVLIAGVITGCARGPAMARPTAAPMEREVVVPTPAMPLPGTFTAPAGAGQPGGVWGARAN